jgi:hypothetical protein
VVVVVLVVFRQIIVMEQVHLVDQVVMEVTEEVQLLLLVCKEQQTVVAAVVEVKMVKPLALVAKELLLYDTNFRIKICYIYYIILNEGT